MQRSTSRGDRKSILILLSVGILIVLFSGISCAEGYIERVYGGGSWIGESDSCHVDETLKFDFAVKSPDTSSINCGEEDINKDGVVDAADYISLKENFGECSGCNADINNDGIVDMDDVSLLSSKMGEICSSDPDFPDMFYNTKELVRGGEDYDLSMWNGDVPDGTYFYIDFLDNSDKPDYIESNVLNCSSGCPDWTFDGFQTFSERIRTTQFYEHDCSLPPIGVLDSALDSVSPKCIGNKVIFSYNGTYYNDGDGFFASANFNYTFLFNGTVPNGYNCNALKINITKIYPDYGSSKYVNKSNLTYSEVLPDNEIRPYANITLRYSNGSEPKKDEKITLHYKFIFDYFEGSDWQVQRHKELDWETKECSANCTIPVPEEYVKQDMRIKIKVYLDHEYNGKTAYGYTPYFDVFVSGLDSSNVLFNDTELVENKPVMTRASVSIRSYLRYGETGVFKYEDYIKSIENVRLIYLINDEVAKTGFYKIVKYEGKERLKQKVVDKKFSVEERENAMKILQNVYKKDMDKISYINYVAPKKGNAKFEVKIDSSKKYREINEFNKTNNNFSRTYVLRSQKDPNFVMMYSGVNIIINPKFGRKTTYNLGNYAREKVRINQSFDFINSAFPFDPKKTQLLETIKPSTVIINPSPIFGLDLDDDLLRGAQKQADKKEGDVFFVIIPQKVADLINIKMKGMSSSESYSNSALAREDAYYGTFAHELGHLFGLYLDSEQKSGYPCPDSAYGVRDIGLLASDGFCIVQDTGQPCPAIDLFARHGFYGEEINIWTQPSEDGCYKTSDAPNGYDTNLPFNLNQLSYGRNFDIMGLSEMAWPRKETYDFLKNKILRKAVV